MEELQQLIQDCKANKRLSQEKLYRKFYPPLFLLCKRFYTDDHMALQVLNDGMMKVFENIDRYDQTKGAFFNWVYTIIRNTALDGLKPAAQKPLYSLTEQPSGDFKDNPLQALEWKDIYILLDTLPPATRVICSLYYLEGFSMADIAGKLSISSGTVKWHLSEIRTKLKPVIKNYFL